MWRAPAVLASVATAVFLLVPDAHAATYPNFVLDLSKSSISVSPTACRGGNCGIKASFAKTGTKTLSFSSVGQTIRLDDLIQWSTGRRAGLQKVAVKLAFTSPAPGKAGGPGKALTWATLNFKSSGALLWWTGSTPANFEQGSQLSTWMGKTISLVGKKKTKASDVFITAKKLVPLEAPAAAPVPALIPALLLALAGLGLAGRRQSRRLRGRQGLEPVC